MVITIIISIAVWMVWSLAFSCRMSEDGTSDDWGWHYPKIYSGAMSQLWTWTIAMDAGADCILMAVLRAFALCCCEDCEVQESLLLPNPSLLPRVGCGRSVCDHFHNGIPDQEKLRNFKPGLSFLLVVSGFVVFQLPSSYICIYKLYKYKYMIIYKYIYI